jgi:hypothetical protein
MKKRIDGIYRRNPLGQITNYTIMGHFVPVFSYEDRYKMRWLLGKVQANLRTYGE